MAASERLEEVRKGLEAEAPGESAIYGLYNVNERIKLSFGAEYGISVESEYGEGSEVTVRLPKILTEIVEKSNKA